MAEAVAIRLQTPEDSNGERKDMHVITTAQEVIVDDETMLDDKLTQLEIQVSSTQPSFPCLWAKVNSTD